ncbi:hypothetical protein [Streptomyces sp. NPDC058307]|uniref:hypothetical protein n=1 Tax=Streptomyces sp. NPDC058307 TaxID=3346439 RepID=UPI0036E39778
MPDGSRSAVSRCSPTKWACAHSTRGLHRHFEDFDAFLVALVLDRIGRIALRSRTLRESAGTGDVVGNLAAA